jgi:hypothetical protein
LETVLARKRRECSGCWRWFGRNVKWFFQQGCSVAAVESASALREIAISNSSTQIIWLDDSLPALASVYELSRQYDLILLFAVWMHLTIKQRIKSMKALLVLLSENRKLVITLRHGSFSDGRETYGVSVAEIEKLGRHLGLSICDVVQGEDSLMRAEVTWQTVMLERRNVSR